MPDLGWGEQGSRAERARSTLLFPVVGGLLGTGLVAAARLLVALPAPGRSAILILLLAAASRRVSLGALSRRLPTAAGVGHAIVLGVLASKVWALAAVGAGLETHALLLAPTLGRWAPVVLAHGARPIGGAPGTPLLMGRVAFREFGWSSVLAFGFAMSVADGLGLVAVVLAALVATGLRLRAYGRDGSMSADMLGASIELVEAAVLVLLAVLARL